MKISNIENEIKCDTVMCNNNATKKLETDSFKGNMFLCNTCFNTLKNLLKKDNQNNATKK